MSSKKAMKLDIKGCQKNNVWYVRMWKRRWRLTVQQLIKEVNICPLKKLIGLPLSEGEHNYPQFLYISPK